MRLGRTARLAAVVLTGGSPGCRGGAAPARGRYVVWLGAAVQDADSGTRPAARIRRPPGRPTGATSPALAWPPARPRRAADGQLAGAPGRRGLRPAAAGRQPGDRGDRERLVYALDQATGRVIWRRHVGTRCRCRTCRAATSTRSASPGRRSTPGQRAGLRGGRDHGIPPRAGGHLGARRRGTGRARHPDPGRAARYDQQRPALASRPGGCTWRSAGCTETAVRTAARWWASRSAAAGR